MTPSARPRPRIARFATPLLALVLLGFLAGCGEPQIRRWTIEEQPAPTSRALVGTEPIVAGTEFRATEHRIDLRVEGVFEVEGVRRSTDMEAVREYSAGLEVAEMSLGILIAPLMIAALPAHYVVVGPLAGSRGDGADAWDTVDYLATIPHDLFDPYENDIFVTEEVERVVGTREEPYRETRAELFGPERTADLRVLRVEAETEEGNTYPIEPAERTFTSGTLSIPDPRAGTTLYRIEIELSGQTYSKTIPVD